MNISLLCKWWWKLETEEGLWQTIVSYKYLKKSSIHDVKHKINYSACWYDLLKVKERGVLIKDGSKTRFWLDSWLYSDPLCVSVPVLFELCENKTMTVAQAMNGDRISFRRWLNSDLRTTWDNIWNDAVDFIPINEKAKIIWGDGKRNSFTVKALYDNLTCSDSDPFFKNIWKGKMPLKIKFFLWLIAKDAILTKENLRKGNGLGTLDVLFVIILRLLIIYSFNVLLLE